MRWWLAAAVLALAPAARAEPSEALSFREAIRRAIAHNSDRQIALEEIARVEGLLAQATSALLPQLDATATYTRLEGDRFIRGVRSAAANTGFARLVASGPIVDLHALAERKRAQDNVAVTAAEAEATKRAVAIETARAYFGAYSSARLLEIAEHARDSARAEVEYATQRRQGGVGTELDLVRVQSELATYEQQISSATIAKLRAEEALGVIIGADRPASAAADPDLGEAREGLGIDNRADVIAERRRTLAAHTSRAMDWLDWVPTLRLAGDGFVDAPQIDPVPRAGYELFIVLDVPIFDGGYRHGTHEQHAALEAEARIREAGIDREATSEVRTAREAVTQTRSAREAAHRASDLAKKTLDLAVIGYHAGTATSLEVVDAQRTALDAATRALLADDEFRSAELDLLAATGAFP